MTFPFRTVQLLSHVWIFVTPWTAAHQTSLSITNSWSLLKLMSIESVMSSNHLILCHLLLLLPLIFPSIRVFSNELVLRIRWLSIGISASASVLPINIQNRFPLGWAGWVSLQSKGLSKVFSNTTDQNINSLALSFSIVQLSHPYISERDGNTRPPDLPSWETCMQIRKQQLELNMEQ